MPTMYILSPRKGRLKKASEVNGEYISLVGIATGSDRLFTISSLCS